MYADEIGASLIFELKNIAYLRFESFSSYINIISPFTRMYLITEGKGHLVIANETIHLEPGFIYLVPSFTACTYVFQPGLSHYYIHFTAGMQNGLNIYNLYRISNKVRANDLVRSLFTRMLEINPDLQLPHHDPKVYQAKPWVNVKVRYHSPNQHLETVGILGQLFSYFPEPGNTLLLSGLLRYNMHQVLLHIQDNLHNDISVKDLACMACLSKDHFTRVFRSLLGISPCEYIIRKRIEKSQLLLLSTNLTHAQIIDDTNFKSASYFSRIFKKYTSFTPAKYRKQRG